MLSIAFSLLSGWWSSKLLTRSLTIHLASYHPIAVWSCFVVLQIQVLCHIWFVNIWPQAPKQPFIIVPQAQVKGRRRLGGGEGGGEKEVKTSKEEQEGETERGEFSFEYEETVSSGWKSRKQKTGWNRQKVEKLTSESISNFWNWRIPSRKVDKSQMRHVSHPHHPRHTWPLEPSTRSRRGEGISDTSNKHVWTESGKHQTCLDDNPLWQCLGCKSTKDIPMCPQLKSTKFCQHLTNVS